MLARSDRRWNTCRYGDEVTSHSPSDRKMFLVITYSLSVQQILLPLHTSRLSTLRCGMRVQRGTRAYQGPLFLSALFSILSSSSGGKQSLLSTRNHVERHSENLDELDIEHGPDPFFGDLHRQSADRTHREEENSVSERIIPRRISYFVEVYENECRGLGRRWREPSRGRSSRTPRWSYKVSI